MTQRPNSGGPTLEVLYFEGCPNHEHAVALVRKALASENVTAPIQIIRVETDVEAHRQRFYGSPSVRINGEDIASIPENATTGLACRVYRTPDGHLTPTPPYETIVAAVRRAKPGWQGVSQSDAGSECAAPAGSPHTRRMRAASAVTQTRYRAAPGDAFHSSASPVSSSVSMRRRRSSRTER